MYAKDFVQVGYNIQTVLHERGITQQQLADQLSVSKQVMSKIVNGAKAINVTEISKIADILGTTTDQLLQLHSSHADDTMIKFMGEITVEETKKKVNRISEVIDQICFLEGIVND